VVIINDVKCPKCGGRFRWQVDPTGRYKSYVMRLGGYLLIKKKQKTETSKENRKV
jgi:uncharacterized C2H2 Zn-finger protein